MLLFRALHQGVQRGFLGCGHVSVGSSVYNSVILANGREDAKSHQSNYKFNLLSNKDQTNVL